MIRRTFLKMVLASPLAGLVKKKEPAIGTKRSGIEYIGEVSDQSILGIPWTDTTGTSDKIEYETIGTVFAYRTGYDGVFIIVIGRRFPQGFECTHFTIEDFRPLGRCGFYEWNNLFQDWDEMELWANFRVRNYIEGAILL